MIWIALNMLIRDKGKFLMLVSALSFATLLMAQQSAVFCGAMRWMSSTIFNTRAQIWVMDPTVVQANDIKPLADNDVQRVRSAHGVKWAVPFFKQTTVAKLPDGNYKTVDFFGVDDFSLFGIPNKIVMGKLEDLWEPNAVILDQHGFDRINQNQSKPLKIGDTFEINDHELKIVGVVDAMQAFIDLPFVYTTLSRALEVMPLVRRNISFILAEPDPTLTALEVAQSIHKETGLKAVTSDQFFWDTLIWNLNNTAVPISFAITIALGFFVGAVVSGQTYYLFILENMRYLGALKAMGASTGLITKMLLVQAFVTGILSYGIGLGLASLFGLVTIIKKTLPFYLPIPVMIGVLIAILLNCTIAVLIGIHRVQKLEAAEVFRA